MIQDILDKTELNREDIIALLKTEAEGDLAVLFKKADDVRKQYCGNEVYLRGIIEFSNYCEQDCLYCGLRKSNESLERYRMSKEEILRTAESIFRCGIKTVVLQSGEDFNFSCEEIRELITAIKNRLDVAVTLSLGERSFNEYNIWKKAGADRYLLKHETADTKLYPAYHNGQFLKERIGHLRFLKSAGYQTGSGNLTGLPGQKIESVADDILLCRELDADMVSFSPFIPSPGTPYRRRKPAEVNKILKVMAIARIVLKDVHMPATTALAALDPDGWEKGLNAGADVVMLNFTPDPFRARYSIYPNKNSVSDSPRHIHSMLAEILNSAGRHIASGKGHSLKRIYL